MRIAFTKMNGAGNDFILIDNRDQRIELAAKQIARLCDRQRGIGADGLFLLAPNPSGTVEWSWQFYNSDGGSAEMCGNGACCFAAFVRDLTHKEGNVTFETRAGVIDARFDGDHVTVTLTAPKNLELDQTLEMDGNKLLALVEHGSAACRDLRRRRR